MQFLDRHDAGRRLAAELVTYAEERPVVVALPRGGVPIAVEVARALDAPLDVLAVRKLGAPGNPELAVGAVAEDGTGVFDQRSADMLGMTEAMLDATLARESEELRRRVERYRDGRTSIPVNGRTVIVVDDGLATGLTDLAAVRALRKRGARRIIVAVPVGSSESVSMLAEEADQVLCLVIPRRLFGVGMWYRDFAPVSDEEVLALLTEPGVHAGVPVNSRQASIPARSTSGGRGLEQRGALVRPRRRPARRRPDDARIGIGSRDVRARQWKQPHESTQPRCRACPQRCGPGDASLRSSG